ncbi:AMP-binding protein [Oryzicola mucosus]|uniref:AMP-binding protein n=1 Tax=Oryzicola mucosus TaxID=2767425 RepID=UPI002ED83865
MSYRDFNHLVTRAAAGLWAVGMRPGDVIGIQLPNILDFAIFQQAAVRMGAIYLPLIPQLRALDLSYLLDVVKARVLVIPGGYRGFDHTAMIDTISANVPSLQKILVAGEASAFLEDTRTFLDQPWETQHGTHISGIVRDPDSVRIISFTSGTESKPKAVQHSHNTMLFPLRNHTRLFGLSVEDVIFTPSPVGHSTGAVFGVEMGLYFGGTVVLMDGWHAERAVEVIAREGASIMWGATTFYNDLVNAPNLSNHDLSRFRLLCTAGAPIPRSLVTLVKERIGGQLVTAYGQSEGQNITITRPDDPIEKVTGSDGRFQEGIDYRLVDGDGKPVAAGDEGEIHYRGPNVCMGYLDPEHSDHAFAADGFIKSGDLGIMDEDGYLRIVGRRKEIIIRGGENISPAEIEDYLFKHPKIASVAVVGLPDERLGQRACAAVIVRDGATLTLAELTEFMSELGVAKFKYPERLELVSDLPRTLTGKVQRDILRNRILTGTTA